MATSLANYGPDYVDGLVQRSDCMADLPEFDITLYRVTPDRRLSRLAVAGRANLNEDTWRLRVVILDGKHISGAHVHTAKAPVCQCFFHELLLQESDRWHYLQDCELSFRALPERLETIISQPIPFQRYAVSLKYKQIRSQAYPESERITGG